MRRIASVLLIILLLLAGYCFADRCEFGQDGDNCTDKDTCSGTITFAFSDVNGTVTGYKLYEVTDPNETRTYYYLRDENGTMLCEQDNVTIQCEDCNYDENATACTTLYQDDNYTLTYTYSGNHVGTSPGTTARIKILRPASGVRQYYVTAYNDSYESSWSNIVTVRIWAYCDGGWR